MGWQFGNFFLGLSFLGCLYYGGRIFLAIQSNNRKEPPPNIIPPTEAPRIKPPDKVIPIHAKTRIHAITNCPKCGQGLKVPVLDKTLRVSCNACSHKFLYSYDKNSSLDV